MARRGPVFGRADLTYIGAGSSLERTMDETVGIMGMPGVGFFGMLIIGFLAGYIAERP